MRITPGAGLSLLRNNDAVVAGGDAGADNELTRWHGTDAIQGSGLFVGDDGQLFGGSGGATITADGAGGLAHGVAEYGGFIYASAEGAFAHGHAYSGTIDAGSKGAVALGYASSGAITASGIGAMAGGSNSSSVITASGVGAHAFGSATSAAGIYATNDGAFARGYATYYGTITASAKGAVASGNSPLLASGKGAHALGIGARATHPGELALSATSSLGNFQHSHFSLSSITSSAGATQLLMVGAALTIASGEAWAFDILTIGCRAGVAETLGVRTVGVIRNIGGTTALVGSVTQTVLGDDGGGGGVWSVLVEADDAADSLKITVTGEAAKTIYWHAAVHASMVSNA